LRVTIYSTDSQHDIALLQLEKWTKKTFAHCKGDKRAQYKCPTSL